MWLISAMSATENATAAFIDDDNDERLAIPKQLAQKRLIGREFHCLKQWKHGLEKKHDFAGCTGS